MESRFQIKICCFVIRLCTFAHSYLTTHFLNLNDTRFIAERSTHSHIQRFCFFFIGMMLMKYLSLHIFVSIVEFMFIFIVSCFVLSSFTLFQISMSKIFTYFFFVRVKPIQNVAMNMKKRRDIIYAQLKKCDLCLRFGKILALPAFCIEYI